MADDKKPAKEKKPNPTLEKAKAAVIEGRVDQEYPSKGKEFIGLSLAKAKMDNFAEEIEIGADKKRHMKNANFTNADLSGCVFDDMILQGAIFRGANLTGASFVGADLRWSDFSGADLTDADFTDAILGIQGEVVGI